MKTNQANDRVDSRAGTAARAHFAPGLRSLAVAASLILGAGLIGAGGGCAAPKASIAYQSHFTPLPARIVPASKAEGASAPTVLARLENRKLALMVRDRSGRMQPFYVRGIETGFYDTRNQQGIDWEQVFAGYQQLGANTALFMVHWQDLEPQPGKYDFAFMDRIVAAAGRHEVKIWWVLFLRCSVGHPVSGGNAWVYRFLNQDGADHSIQWIKTKDGKLLNNADAHLEARTRIYPEYAHPGVFSHIEAMLGALGRHYRNSPDVLGVQIGNEEGFNDAGEGDFNPAAIALFEQWKAKTTDSDEARFKMEINKYWWQQFTTAFHRGDPYKLTSYNLLGGGPEAGYDRLIRRMGVDSSIYGEGNLDVIGTMFYGTNGARIWPNLDRQYQSYVYALPILVPSEIGLGPKWGPRAQFQEYAINAIERGAQGYSAYCYGELMETNGQPNAFGQSYRKLAAMVQANQDLIYAGVPGPGNVSMGTTTPGAKISQLHGDANGTLGILHFPNAYLRPKPDANTNAVAVRVEFKVEKGGKYKVEVYRDGALQSSATRQLEPGKAGAGLNLVDVRETEAIFLRATRLEMRGPAQ